MSKIAQPDARATWEAAVLASGLPDSLKVACWALRKFANSNGECYPSANRLAQTYNVNRSTVFRHLKRLDRIGWIGREPGKGQVGKGGTTTRYKLTFPESSCSHDATPSTDESSRSQDATTSESQVVANPNEVVANPPEVVADSTLSSRTHSATRTMNQYRTNTRTSAPHSGAHVKGSMKSDKATSATKQPREIRPGLLASVRNYGSRDPHSAHMFLKCAYHKLRRAEVEAAIYQLRKDGEL